MRRRILVALLAVGVVFTCYVGLFVALYDFGNPRYTAIDIKHEESPTSWKGIQVIVSRLDGPAYRQSIVDYCENNKFDPIYIDRAFLPVIWMWKHSIGGRHPQVKTERNWEP